MRAMWILLKRQESGKNYTIFSDSMAAMNLLCTEQTGPGQALAKGIIHLEKVLNKRGCAGTIQWASAHREVEGNEIADSYAKWAAGAIQTRREASHAYLTITEARIQGARDWIRRHVKAELRYRHPRGESSQGPPERREGGD